MSLTAITLMATVLGINESSAVAAWNQKPNEPVIGAYYANWETGSHPISEIPADSITNLYYSFGGITDGVCDPSSVPAADVTALRALKAAHPKLKVSISIGGWGAPGFSDAALTDASRKKFVSSCMDLYFGAYKGAFDGVDIDWEFPVSGGPSDITDRPEDKANATLLVAEFRREMDALGGAHKVLTAALPTGRLQTDGPYDPAASFDLRAMGKDLDWINLMTYAEGTGFSAVSTFDAPMFPVPQDPLGQPMKTWNNVAGSVLYYELNGVPADKIVLGVPFYGEGFNVTQAGSDHGLYQPYSSTFGVDSWPDVKALIADPSWKQYWNPVAQAPWLYNASEKKFLSFEDPRSIGIRSGYAKLTGLRGAFMWELSEDDADYSMLSAMASPW